MLNGYCLIVRDYKAEICEFVTHQTFTMPDDSKLFYVQTKYGFDYFNEKEVHQTREELVEECEQLNKALVKGGTGGKEKSLYKPR